MRHSLPANPWHSEVGVVAGTGVAANVVGLAGAVVVVAGSVVKLLGAVDSTAAIDVVAFSAS